MSPEQLGQPHELLLTPRFPTIRGSFRVSFISATERVVYDLIEFEIAGKQFGISGEQRVVELSSTSTHVPFQMQLKFGLDDAAYSFEVETRFSGHDILDVQKIFRALRMLKAGATLELFDLKQQRTVGPINVELTSISEGRDEFERLTDQLAEVSLAFGQKLVAPDIIDKKDLETLAFLIEVCRHGELKGGSVENLAAKLVRSAEPSDVALGPLAGEFMIGLENANYPVQQLLGAQISVGPWRTIIEKASVLDFQDLKNRYDSLTPGESMPVRFIGSGPVRQVFHRFYKGEPLAPLVAI
jgi:hypothetical protein